MARGFATGTDVALVLPRSPLSSRPGAEADLPTDAGFPIHGADTCSESGPLDGLLQSVDSAGAGPVVLHYSPYMWSTRGLGWMAVRLVRALSRQGREVDVVFHEMWVPWSVRPGGLLRTLLQRAMAAALAAFARRIIVTSRERIGEIARIQWWDRQRALLAPLPSLIDVAPGAGSDRRGRRATLGLGPTDVLVGVFGFDHDSRPLHGLETVRLALHAAGVKSRLLVLGTARWPSQPAPAWVAAPGYLPDDEVSRWMASLDLLVAPFVDGISTRRTSTAAALAHGIPVVSTCGPHTDEGLLTPARVALAPLDDPGGLGNLVVELAKDPARRLALGRGGLELYRQHLDWPVHLEILRRAHGLER